MRARARARVVTCMIMTRALLLGLLLVPLACGDDGIQPRSGTWVFANGEITKNTCNMEGEPSSGDFTLLNNEDGTFIIDPEDGTENFLCTLMGADFDCPERLQETVMQAGVDATVDVRVRATGTFTSPTAAKGQQDATVTCTGTACNAVETLTGVQFPCEVSATYSAAFKQ